MKLAEKDFPFYWDIIKFPSLVLILWSVAGLLTVIISYAAYRNMFSSAAGLIIGFLVFAFVGWTAAKDCKGTIKQAAWAGAITGVVAGFVGAIIGVIITALVPSIIEDAVSQAVAQGAAAATARSFIQISVYLGFVIGPLFNGIIGAIIATISAFIACKLK